MQYKGNNYPNEWKIVNCRDWCEDDERIWLTLSDRNAICEIDKYNGKIRVLGSFPNNKLSEYRLSYSVCKIDNLVVYCPLAANDIAIYDVKNRELEFIGIPRVERLYYKKYREDSKFLEVFSHERNIFMGGLLYPGILMLNVDSKELKILDGWIDLIDRHCCRKDVNITRGYAIVGEEAILPLGSCNGVLKMNLKTYEFSYVDLKVNLNGIQGIAQNKTTICITGRDYNTNSFLIWDSINNSIKNVRVPIYDEFSAPITVGDSFVLFGKRNNRSFIYDTKTEIINEISNYINPYGGISAAKQVNEFLCFISEYGEGLYYYNPETSAIGCRTLLIEDEIFLERTWISFCKHQMKKSSSDTIYEGIFGVSDYISELQIWRDK